MDSPWKKMVDSMASDKMLALQSAREDKIKPAGSPKFQQGMDYVSDHASPDAWYMKDDAPGFDPNAAWPMNTGKYGPDLFQRVGNAYWKLRNR